MSEAFETACELLRDASQREVARAARRIISAARFGEHDPIQLRAAALAGCRNWLKPISAPFSARRDPLTGALAKIHDCGEPMAWRFHISPTRAVNHWSPPFLWEAPPCPMH